MYTELPIAGCIAEPAFLEGGDFFPMGQDLALVGVGLRSNEEACVQLMDNDLLGTERLGIVGDEFDRNQVNEKWIKVHNTCPLFTLLTHKSVNRATCNQKEESKSKSNQKIKIRCNTVLFEQQKMMSLLKSLLQTVLCCCFQQNCS